MTETDIQNAIRIELSRQGAIVIRLNTGNFELKDGRRIVCGVKGLSDLLAILPEGKVAFIEVKTATGRPSPEQLAFIRRMHELKHRAGIARSVEEALELIK